MKRIFDLEYQDFMTLKSAELIETIKHSEGRTVMSETVISLMSLSEGISNPELAKAFGADLITLNTFNMEKPFIFGYDDRMIKSYGSVDTYAEAIIERIAGNQKNPDYIRDFKAMVGRFLGVNLEPIYKGQTYPEGLKLTRANLERFRDFGFDYLMITANPNTGVDSDDIIQGVQLAREVLGENVFIIAGKMHGASTGNIYDESSLQSFMEAGADCILLPAPGTVPAMNQALAERMIELVHAHGKLAMTTIGTSQESSDEATIQSIALMAKMAGADIQHIGDAGFMGIALPENIMTLSRTIRGKRHTYRQIARSSRR